MARPESFVEEEKKNGQHLFQLVVKILAPLQIILKILNPQTFVLLFPCHQMAFKVEFVIAIQRFRALLVLSHVTDFLSVNV